jgi:serine/threonine-protein kinase
LRFDLLGFPVRVHGTFWLTSLLLARPTALDRASLVRVATWTVIVFVSILVHELGHALAMRACGRSASIELVALGGFARWGEGPRVSGWKRALVSLAGPGAGFVLAAPVVVAWALGVRPPQPWALEAARTFLWVNVGWGIVNLLPILPLDGGRMLQATLVTLFGRLGGQISRYSSLVLGAAVALVAMRFGLAWIVMLGVLGLWQTYRESPIEDASLPETRRETPDEAAARLAIEEAYGLLWGGNPDAAEAAAERGLAALPASTDHDWLRGRLVQVIAWARVDGGDFDGAQAAIRRLPPGEAPMPLLVARIELSRHDSPAALEKLEAAFWEAPGDSAALVLGAAYVERKKPEKVVELLRKADRAIGLPALDRLGAALFHSGAFEGAFEIEQLSWQRFPHARFAYNAACSLARMGRTDDALAWLARAVNAGWDDAASVDGDPDLAPLRADPRFAEIRARVGTARPDLARRARSLAPLVIVAVIGVAYVGWSRVPSSPRPPRATDGTGKPFSTLPRPSRPADRAAEARLDAVYADLDLEGDTPIDAYAVACDDTRCEVGVRLYSGNSGGRERALVPLRGAGFEASVLAQGTASLCTSRPHERTVNDCFWVDVRCSLPGVTPDALVAVGGSPALDACVQAMIASIDHGSLAPERRRSRRDAGMIAAMERRALPAAPNVASDAALAATEARSSVHPMASPAARTVSVSSAPTLGYASVTGETPEAEIRADLEGASAIDDGQRYELGPLLGVGGMGEVHLFRDARIGRAVARKTLRTGTTSSRAVARFLREARVQGQLEHPSIVPVYDLAVDAEGRPYFTMKRVRGDTLALVLGRIAGDDPDFGARYPRRRLLAAFVQVCLAVAYAHGRGVIHRDLKPGNLMIGDLGQVYVLDWGLAKLATEGAGTEGSEAPTTGGPAHMTREGDVVGTPMYMPPEQLAAAPLDARADVYSLGAILFEILTLEPLRTGDSLEKIMISSKEKATRPSDRVANVPPELDDLCARMLAVDAGDRVQTARAVAEAVERYLEGDRDLAARRAQAEGLLASARARLASSNGAETRVAAMQEALKALALVPEDTEAQKLLLSLVVDGSGSLPPVAEAEFAEGDVRDGVRGLRFGVVGYAAWLLSVPLIMWAGVRSWTMPAVMIALTLVAIAYSVMLLRRGGRSLVQSVALATLSGTIVALSSTWLGPFVLTPIAACATAVMFVIHGSRRERPWFLAVWTAAALAPFAVELAGTFPPAASFVNGDLVLHARSISLPFGPTMAALAYTSVSFIVLLCLFVGKLRDAQRAAERKLFVQAWHLRQLFPGALGVAPSLRRRLLRCVFASRFAFVQAVVVTTPVVARNVTFRVPRVVVLVALVETVLPPRPAVASLARAFGLEARVGLRRGGGLRARAGRDGRQRGGRRRGDGGRLALRGGARLGLRRRRAGGRASQRGAGEHQRERPGKTCPTRRPRGCGGANVGEDSSIPSRPFRLINRARPRRSTPRRARAPRRPPPRSTRRARRRGRRARRSPSRATSSGRPAADEPRAAASARHGARPRGRQPARRRPSWFAARCPAHRSRDRGSRRLRPPAPAPLRETAPPARGSPLRWRRAGHPANRATPPSGPGFELQPRCSRWSWCQSPPRSAVSWGSRHDVAMAVPPVARRGRGTCSSWNSTSPRFRGMLGWRRNRSVGRVAYRRATLHLARRYALRSRWSQRRRRGRRGRPRRAGTVLARGARIRLEHRVRDRKLARGT